MVYGNMRASAWDEDPYSSAERVLVWINCLGGGGQGLTMKTRTLSGKKIRARRERRARRKRLAAIMVALAGVILLIAAGWGWWSGRQTAAAAMDYGPADVSYDQPYHAVHEMGAGPPIPFLPQDGPQPEIGIGDDFYNFGSIGPTEVVTRDFVIANMGDAPLTISRAYTTCGCTTADFTSSVIPPGKVSIVTVTLDAGVHDVRGQTVRRGVIIENNDPSRSNVEIWVQASVRTQ